MHNMDSLSFRLSWLDHLTVKITCYCAQAYMMTEKY